MGVHQKCRLYLFLPFCRHLQPLSFAPSTYISDEVYNITLKYSIIYIYIYPFWSNLFNENVGQIYNLQKGMYPPHPKQLLYSAGGRSKCSRDSAVMRFSMLILFTVCWDACLDCQRSYQDWGQGQGLHSHGGLGEAGHEPHQPSLVEKDRDQFHVGSGVLKYKWW